MSVVLVTQARVGSSRLNSKVLLPLGSETVLDVHLGRLKKSTLVNEFVVATTKEPGVDAILAIAKRHGFKSYQGSTDDVLSRFYGAVSPMKPKVVVRVTSDCPLIDPKIVDWCISEFEKKGVDYAANTLNPTFPDGMDCEVFSFSSLEKAFNQAKLQSEREHVTPYIWKNSDLKGGNIFKAASLENDKNLESFRLTVDYPDDLAVLNQLVANLGVEAGWKDYVAELRRLNLEKSQHTRNEGYAKTISEEQE